MTYADVIVPLPVDGLFTYTIPQDWEGRVQKGMRVVVPFGRKKFYTAIVVRVHGQAPEGYSTKEIVEVLDTYPVVSGCQFRFWQWVADYYLCTTGEVYKASMPSGMKLESETRVTCNPDFVAQSSLPEREQRVLDALSCNDDQTLTELEKHTGIGNVLPVVNRLLAKEAIYIKEELKRGYKPRMEAFVRFTDAVRTEEDVHRLFDALARAPKQLAVLMKYIELSGWARPGCPPKPVSRKELLQASGATPAVCNGLVGKGVFEICLQHTGRLPEGEESTVPLNPLSEAQQRAFEEITKAFATKEICLLHGVTSSGKTEIYMHLIEQVLREGKQVLYLLPEIALTTQITERLRRVFGNRLCVYHSKYPDAERVEIWQKLLSSQGCDVVLGVRSSVFLPFSRLGLVIVDEEHETSYKQQDPAPRYHARNAAMVLASIYGAKTLLGTATPSIETYYNAQHGKYGLVRLTERHQRLLLPLVEVVDTKELARKKLMTSRFSPLLLQKVREALEQRMQVILFQNRRGFAPMVECRTCGWVPKCRNCDVSLTYHKRLNRMTCHYCGYTSPVPQACPACGGVELTGRGFGTEKVEDDIKAIFPEAHVARMDLDTTRTRAAYERIITDFEEGKTDILIGTQMVSKGLDFDRVSVVGILNADSMMNYPDFRSYERAFQLMAQVAGRAGRKNGRGTVILQTRSPDLPLIREVVENDYEGMYREQIGERELFHYPPFSRLVYVYLKHRKPEVADEAAAFMAQHLRYGLAGRVLGPDQPPVSRIQALYIRKIVVKVERQVSMPKVRAYLRQIQRTVTENERFRSLLVYYDVDPM